MITKNTNCKNDKSSFKGKTAIVIIQVCQTSTTSVDTAGNLIAENLHMTSENADFNGLIHSCNSEGLTDLPLNELTMCYDIVKREDSI